MILHLCLLCIWCAGFPWTVFHALWYSLLPKVTSRYIPKGFGTYAIHSLFYMTWFIHRPLLSFCSCRCYHWCSGCRSSPTLCILRRSINSNVSDECPQLSWATARALSGRKQPVSFILHALLPLLYRFAPPYPLPRYRTTYLSAKPHLPPFQPSLAYPAAYSKVFLSPHLGFFFLVLSHVLSWWTEDSSTKK